MMVPLAVWFLLVRYRRCVKVTLDRLDPTGGDRSDLITFLTGNEWPFHVRTHLTRADVERSIDEGAYHDGAHDTFWVHHVEHGRIGIVRLEDLEDPTPLFDLRLDARFRGKGWGTAALHATTRYLFTTRSELTRFEGQTREDNIAMRKVFLRCGWLKEAHYRESWPIEGATPVASVAYGVLRRDWESGETTGFEWQDVAL